MALLDGWRGAGADVSRPVLGHRSPGHLAVSAHPAQHGRRRRLHVARRRRRQRTAAVTSLARRRVRRGRPLLSHHDVVYYCFSEHWDCGATWLVRLNDLKSCSEMTC